MENKDAAMEAGGFDFTRMQGKVDELWPDTGIFGGPGERRAIAAAALGAAVVGVASIAPRAPWTEGVLWMGLVFESVGVAAYLAISVRSAWRAYRSPDHSRHRFDAGFDRRHVMLGWLRQFPSGTLRDRVAYLSAQREILRSHLSVIAGAADKLGILPVLAALFLQIRSASTGFRMTFFEGLFAVFLLVLYAISMWAAGAARQMDFFRGLLLEAIEMPGTSSTSPVATSTASVMPSAVAADPPAA